MPWKDKIIECRKRENRIEKYEERVIVFIDILGFSNYINKSEDDEKIFIKLTAILDYFTELKSESDKSDLLRKEFTVFSDSIVISYPSNVKGAVFFLLQEIAQIQLDLASKDILIRGAITVGSLIHTSNLVYGPAMIEAYKLESQVAIYPRVLVSDKAIESGLKYRLNDYDNEKYHINCMIKKDFDNQYFVNYLAQEDELDDLESYKWLCERIKENIEQSLKENKNNFSIATKYGWLRNYYEQLFNY